MKHMEQYSKIQGVNVLRKIFLVTVCICNSLLLHSQTETVSDIDGNVYKTINICSQKWMAENLKTTRKNDGTKIVYIADSANWSKVNNGNQYDSGYYSYSNFDSSTVSTHGRLYNWIAVRSNKLCPIGWHVPKYDDWLALIYALVHNESDEVQCSYFIAKSLASTSGWVPSTDPDNIGYNQETNNKSEFNALPISPILIDDFNFNNYNNWHKGNIISFWSSTSVERDYTRIENAYCFGASTDADIRYLSIYDGLPVRCLKDEANEVDNITAAISAKTSIICNEDSVTLKAIVTGGVKPFRYSWNCFESHNTEYTVSPPQNTIYKLTIVDSLKCYATSNIYIKKEFTPMLKLPNDTLFCDSVHLKIAINSTSTALYTWQDGKQAINYTIKSPGVYSVTGKNDCGTSSDSIKIEMSKVPDFYLPSDTSIYEGKKIVINVKLPGYYHYSWQDNSHNPHYPITTEGKYTISISDSNNCVLTKSILVHKECFLDVPTAFSPNYDGLNDVLYPVGNDIENLTFSIYNRWGQKMFESNSLTEGWDGTFMGQILESATFMYTISATGKTNGKAFFKKGNVSLIR